MPSAIAGKEKEAAVEIFACHEALRTDDGQSTRERWQRGHLEPPPMSETGHRGLLRPRQQPPGQTVVRNV